jgi:peptidoglycan/xylan/chitin deacetylase (PgdA/CDA1 family)
MTAVMERVQQHALRLRRRLVPATLILAYHRVCRMDDDPWTMGVPPARFAQQMEVLRGQARPIGLSELVRGVSHGTRSRRSVVVMFDDGYADSLYHAKPLLERYEIPATFFITSGYLGQAEEFWWDELERLLLRPPSLPSSLQLQLNGREHVWRIGKAPGLTSAKDLCHSLWGLLRGLEAGERRTILKTLRAWTGDRSVARTSHRPMTIAELLQLASGPLIEIGAHTVTHSALCSLSPALQRQEIVNSKATLEELLNRSVTSFSYLFGRPHDYTPASVALVEQADFLCACTNMAGVVERRSNVFQLPRLRLQELDGEQFGRVLTWWFDG